LKRMTAGPVVVPTGQKTPRQAVPRSPA
jgi:hypothetical protein